MEVEEVLPTCDRPYLNVRPSLFRLPFRVSHYLLPVRGPVFDYEE